MMRPFCHPRKHSIDIWGRCTDVLRHIVPWNANDGDPEPQNGPGTFAPDRNDLGTISDLGQQTLDHRL
eukprot:830763-Alexandrium_andersonii.AAC.1